MKLPCYLLPEFFVPVLMLNITCKLTETKPWGYKKTAAERWWVNDPCPIAVNLTIFLKLFPYIIIYHWNIALLIFIKIFFQTNGWEKNNISITTLLFLMFFWFKVQIIRAWRDYIFNFNQHLYFILVMSISISWWYRIPQNQSNMYLTSCTMTRTVTK